MELKKNFRNFIKIDAYLLTAIVGLSFLGLLNLAGIGGFENVFFKKQLLFFSVGLVLLLSSSSIDYRIFRNYSLPSTLFFIVSVFLLLLTLKAQPIRGVSAWLHLPLGFSFETSEIVKLALVLFLARFFTSRAGFNNIYVVAISALYSFLLIFLVFSQPDLGAAFVLFLIWLAGILLFGLEKRQLFGIATILILVFLIIGVFILQPYQKSRLASFLSVFQEEREASYNISQAKIAIGSGGFWGQGFQEGTQAKFGLLPEANTDFAFAALMEQFGFIALLASSVLYFIILNRLFFIGTRAKDNFSRFFIFLFMTYFFTHVIINIGVNLGLLPITGLPLPFISYGGSFLISLMIGFGIVENIRANSA